MRELFLENRSLTGEDGIVRSYDYFVTIDEMDVGPYACESYGVRIAEQGGAEAAVHSVTCSISRIDELCGLILRHQVTPTTLKDVVSDWL